MLLCKQPFCITALSALLLQTVSPTPSSLCPAGSHPELPFGGSALILSLPSLLQLEEQQSLEEALSMATAVIQYEPVPPDTALPEKGS